jgi:hypothetical protein
MLGSSGIHWRLPKAVYVARWKYKLEQPIQMQLSGEENTTEKSQRPKPWIYTMNTSKSSHHHYY